MVGIALVCATRLLCQPFKEHALVHSILTCIKIMSKSKPLPSGQNRQKKQSVGVYVWQ